MEYRTCFKHEMNIKFQVTWYLLIFNMYYLNTLTRGMLQGMCLSSLDINNNFPDFMTKYNLNPNSKHYYICRLNNMLTFRSFISLLLKNRLTESWLLYFFNVIMFGKHVLIVNLYWNFESISTMMFAAEIYILGNSSLVLLIFSNF